MMRNLLAETLQILAENGRGAGSVRWVGTRSAVGSWDEFAALANFDYDAGYGGNEIPMDLMVVGDNWWLERHAYDGSEWWEFKERPQRPLNVGPLRLSDLTGDR